jgi:ABC-2 type transport system ATP-binding protein
VSSHLLAEIEQMCDRVTVMRAGRVVAAGTLQELSLLARPSVVVETPDHDAAVAVLRRLGATSAAPDPDGLRVRAELPDVPVEDVTRALVHAGVAVRGIGRSGRSLEELFVDLTGEGFDVVG